MLSLGNPSIGNPSIWLSLAASIAASGFCSAQAPGTPADAEAYETVYYDYLTDSGELRGGQVRALFDAGARETAPVPAAITTWTFGTSGDPANRIDVVFVGDGYLASELGEYAAHVADHVVGYFQEAPYTTYAPYFNVHVVDVVSNESGVDHDPTFPIYRDTALGMGYWCAGIERLLCVNVSAAYSYANNAPDVDLLIAIANSTKYGGAGYPQNDLATAAGDNPFSTEILLHEIGHALGDLADEYDYGDGATYDGPELPAPNVSILSAAEMQSQGTKWSAWLGVNDPAFDGLVSTYEGAHYHQFGINRPTGDSLMRSLDRPFNLPSVEAILIEIYRLLDPIDAASSTDAIHGPGAILFVTPLEPIGHALDIQWSLDGVPIPGANGELLDLCSLDLSAGAHLVRVEVVDNTAWVRDEAARDSWMTGVREYDVFAVADSGVASTCQTSPNSVGPGAVMSWSGTTSVAANDFRLEVSQAPSGTPGLFYFGTSEEQIPFGDGLRCVGGSLHRLAARTVDPDGTLSQELDFPGLPPQVAIEAGDLRYFQFWYRDPSGGPAGFNLSDGLRATFCN